MCQIERWAQRSRTYALLHRDTTDGWNRLRNTENIWNMTVGFDSRNIGILLLYRLLSIIRSFNVVSCSCQIARPLRRACQPAEIRVCMYSVPCDADTMSTAQCRFRVLLIVLHVASFLHSKHLFSFVPANQSHVCFAYRNHCVYDCWFSWLGPLC